MEDIHSLLYRQNENLRRLEVALSDAMSRIEIIEKIYVGDKEKSFKSEQPGISENNISNRLCESIYGVRNDCDSAAITETTNVNKTSPENEFNEIRMDKYLEDIYSSRSAFTIKENFNPSNELKDKLKPTLGSGVDKITMFSSEFINTEKFTDVSNYESLNLNSISTTPNTPLSREITFLHENPERFRYSMKTKSDQLNYASGDYKENEKLHNIQNNDKKLFLSRVIGISDLKMNNHPNYIHEDRNACKKSVDGYKNNETSKRYFIFDEEESSNTRQDPLYLENEENEFYYLKSQIERTSLTCKPKSSLNNLRSFKNSNSKFNEISGEFKSSGPVIREIRYYIPHERIIGYVQLPYNILLDKPNSINVKSESENYTETRKNIGFYIEDRKTKELRWKYKNENLLINKPYPFGHLNQFNNYYSYPLRNISTFPISHNFKYYQNRAFFIIKK
ncbi:hypothetical protein FG386_002830 [Cryptosporidium ryanae]|uniref:uncharacterized protein n=1 Tax=Cryptosporidium ryanae TaxID=515981 RepID=UPI00351A43EE|nr:hypothetical protein FG386_002830 [Cryptosporidium ryanae]